MTDTQQLERLLAGANGGNVVVPRKHAQELAQKLKARGETGPGATRLSVLLDRPGDVELDRAEATILLEELRASGRRWVFGTDEARRQARETRLEMEDWADSILSTLEVNLDKFLGAVKRGRERLHERSQESVVTGVGVGVDGSNNNDPY